MFKSRHNSMAFFKSSLLLDYKYNKQQVAMQNKVKLLIECVKTHGVNNKISKNSHAMIPSKTFSHNNYQLKLPSHHKIKCK